MARRPPALVWLLPSQNLQKEYVSSHSSIGVFETIVRMRSYALNAFGWGIIIQHPPSHHFHPGLSPCAFSSSVRLALLPRQSLQLTRRYQSDLGRLSSPPLNFAFHLLLLLRRLLLPAPLVFGMPWFIMLRGR